MLPSHNFGHRRTRSYFSGFTLSTAQLHAQQRLARSTEKLDQLQLDSNKRAYSARDLSRSSDKEKLEACKVQIEEELELKVQSLLKRKKYKEVTVPISIKFSVSKEQQAFAAMTKPNSATESLDQMLLNIRMKLVRFNDALQACLAGCLEAPGLQTILLLSYDNHKQPLVVLDKTNSCTRTCFSAEHTQQRQSGNGEEDRRYDEQHQGNPPSIPFPAETPPLPPSGCTLQLYTQG